MENDLNFVVERQLKYYNAQDLPMFLSCFSKMVRVSEFPDRLLFSGIEKMEEFYRALFEKFPENQATVTSRTVIGDMVADSEKVMRAYDGDPIHVIAIYRLSKDKNLIEEGQLGAGRVPIELISEADFKSFEKSRTPCIIRNGVETFFPVVSAWTPEILVQKFGDVEILLSDDGRPLLGNAGKRKLKEILSDPKFDRYYAYNTAEYQKQDKTTAFEKDLSFPNPFFDESALSKTVFFRGRKGFGASPHVHGAAFNILAKGRKRWAMWDAMTERGRDLVIKFTSLITKDSKPGEWWEVADIDNLGVKVFVGIQEERDIAYVPDGFCHAVLNESDVLGLAIIKADMWSGIGDLRKLLKATNK